jgi:hypothetical protein
MAEMKLGTSFCGISTVMRIPTTRTKPEFDSRPVQVEFVADKLAFEWYFYSPIHIQQSSIVMFNSSNADAT